MINCAIVGCGRIAHRHAAILNSNQLSSLRLIAGVEPNSARRIDFSESYGINVFENMDDLLHHHHKDIDLVIVCTPSGTHYEVSREVIEAGLNVLIEKPISLRVSDANDLVERAKRRGVKLYVVKQNRFNDVVKSAYSSFSTGVFGRPYLGSIRLFWNRNHAYYKLDEWRGTWKYDGGALINQAIHHLDILQWFLGDIESVFSYGNNFTNPRGAWDSVCASIQFKNGALGSVQISTATQPRDLEASFAFLGSEGTFEIAGKSLNEFRYWETPYRPELADLVKRSETAPPDIYGYGHLEMLQNVALNLGNGTGYVVEGSEATKSLKLASGILRSIETGQVVNFKDFQESSLLGN